MNELGEALTGAKGDEAAVARWRKLGEEPLLGVRARSAAEGWLAALCALGAA